MPQLSTGDNAPPILLPAIDGTTFDLASVRGKSDFDLLPVFNVPAVQHADTQEQATVA